MSFYVVLPSNACPKTQPKNEANSYIIDWQNEMNLSGNWEAALTEISFNYFPKAVKGPAQIFYRKRDFANIKFKFVIKNGKFTASLEYDQLIDNLPVINITYIPGKPITINCDTIPFQLVFNSSQDAKKFGFLTAVTYSETVLIAPNLIEKEKDFETMITVKCNLAIFMRNSIDFDNVSLFPVNDNIHEYIDRFCGQVFETTSIDQNGFFHFTVKDDVEYVEFDKIFAKYLGYYEIMRYVPGIDHKGYMKPSLAQSYYQIYIYSSITEPILVGDVRVPLLRSVWVDSKYHYGDVVYEHIDYPMYLPVATRSINKVEVQIRDDAGQLVNFPPGSKTSLTIHFRKI